MKPISRGYWPPPHGSSGSGAPPFGEGFFGDGGGGGDRRAGFGAVGLVSSAGCAASSSLSFRSTLSLVGWTLPIPGRSTGSGCIVGVMSAGGGGGGAAGGGGGFDAHAAIARARSRRRIP